MAEITLKGEVGVEINLTEVQGLIKGIGEFDELQINITSIGGCSETGRNIYDYLKSLGKPIITKAIDYCYSAAFTIFCAGEKRISEYNNTEFLMHAPWMVSFFVGGDIEAKELYDIVRAEKDLLIKIYSETLGIVREECETLMDNNDIITGLAAKGHNMVTDIENDSDKEKANNELFFYGLFDKVAAAARVNENQKQLQIKIKNKMEAEKINQELQKQSNLLNELVAGIKALFKTKIKALAITSEEGVMIEIEGDELVEGATITNDVPDGTYTVMYNDKKYSVVVEGKVIKTVTEIVDEPNSKYKEIEDLKKENEELKKQLDEMKAIKAKIQEFERIASKFQKPDGTYDFLSGVPQTQSKEKELEARKEKAVAELREKRKLNK